MRNIKIMALIAVTILYGAAVVNSIFFPLALSQTIEKYVGVAVLIMVIVWFINWFRRTRSLDTAEENKKSRWLLILGILFISSALSLMSLAPILFPNLDANGARLIQAGFIVITFIGGVLLVQWLISRH